MPTYRYSLQVEFYIMGRILSQVEQTCIHISPSSRIRINDGQLQALQDHSDVRHILVERLRTRTCHGHRDA